MKISCLKCFSRTWCMQYECKTCSNRSGLSITPTPEWFGHICQDIDDFEKSPATPLKKNPHIFVFFSQIVWFFEISKNGKLQALVSSTFGDHTVKWISILALKWTNFTFFRVSQKRCTKNTKNSVLMRAIWNYPTKFPRKVEAINTWTF